MFYMEKLLFYFLSILYIIMSKTDSIKSEYTSNISQNEHSVTSLRKDCLDNLRFPCSASQHSKPKTHLLACMSEFITEQPEQKADDLDDFCCFDRMKKIIEKRKNYDDNTKENGQREGSENQKLFKFVQIQSKLRKMEQNLVKYCSDGNKKLPTQHKNKQNSQCNPSQPFLFLTSPAERRWEDGIITQENKNKNRSLNVNLNLPCRYQMKKKIREQGYKHYQECQKKIVYDNENSVKKFVENEIEQKVNSLLQERDIKFNQLLQQNKNFQRQILQKNLQIENLKSKQISLTKNLTQLEAIKDMISSQHSKAGRQKQLFFQSFHKQFCETFPNQTIRSLKQNLQTITDKCLYKFNDIQYKKVQQWKEQKSDLKQKIGKLQTTLQRLKSNQNQLLNNIKQFRYDKGVATMQMDSLLQKESQLDRLQKKILSIYNDWYGKLSESEKQLMKNMGYLRCSYQYEQMLEYIVVFEKKFSTDVKLNDYLIKILRGIQRIRKILFPKTNSNSGEKDQKMDPLFILEKLQKYVKSKVYQIQKKHSSNLKETRTSQIIEQQFLGIRQQDKISQHNEISQKQYIQQLEKKNSSFKLSQTKLGLSAKRSIHMNSKCL